MFSTVTISKIDVIPLILFHSWANEQMNGLCEYTNDPQFIGSFKYPIYNKLMKK